MIMMTVVDHLYCNMVLSVVVVKLLQEILLKRETLNVSIIVSLGQRFSNWGPWPPGGPLDGARGAAKKF